MIFRVIRARRTHYDWNLVLRTRIIARMILVTYALAAFGGVFDVGCRDHVGRLGEDHAIQEHVHSKNQLAVHSFIHTALLTDQCFLASPCCCCVYPGNEEADLPDHVLTNHRSWPDFSIRLCLAVLPPVNDLRPTNTGMRVPPDGLQSLPVFLSIHTIVLLI
jgi:hypothetical protein